MSTRAPPAARSLATFAMLRQLASEETLVPPNFRTIQADAVRVTANYLCRYGLTLRANPPGRYTPLVMRTYLRNPMTARTPSLAGREQILTRRLVTDERGRLRVGSWND